MALSTTVKTTDLRFVYSLCILAFYLLGQFGYDFLSPYYNHLLADVPAIKRTLLWSVTYNGIIPLIGTILIFGHAGLGERLGLHKGFWQGLKFAALVTLPMFLGYAWLTDFNLQIDWERDFLFGSVFAPFFEEFFFRAFLFGLLYRYGGWNLWAATLLDGFVFGAIHMYQGEGWVEAFSVFAATGAGGIGFSILYKEWDWNLWLVIFLHAFMNLSWMAFDVADNAAGGVWANVFRMLSIALAIGLTIRRIRSKKGRGRGCEGGTEGAEGGVAQLV